MRHRTGFVGRGHSIAVVCGLALTSCMTATPPSEINELYKEVIYQRDTQYRIKPGDHLSVSFFGNAQFDQELTILPDGRPDPYFMNNPVVAGKTLPEFKAAVREYYGRQINDPEFRVEIQPFGEFVYLQGAVRRPATIAYTLKMTLAELVSEAGGYLDTASADEVILRRPYRNPARPDVFVVNLYDDSEEIFLLPNDQIVVERTIWIAIRDYLREYIWGILPVDPRSLLGGAVAGGAI